jgi:hypothetical protein
VVLVALAFRIHSWHDEALEERGRTPVRAMS